DERRVARVFDALGELVEHLVPGDLLPLVAPGGAVERLVHTPGRGRQLHRRRALRAEPALVDRAVGGALALEGLRVTFAVLLRVGNDRAPHRAVRTQRVHFLGPGDSEVLLNLYSLRDVEAQGRGAQRARTDGAELHEIPSCHLGHGCAPPYQAKAALVSPIINIRTNIRTLTPVPRRPC